MNERFWLASELETKFKATLPKTASGIWGSILDYVFNQIVWTEVAEELLDKLSETEG